MKKKVLKQLKKVARLLPTPKQNSAGQRITWKANYRRMKKLYKGSLKGKRDNKNIANLIKS